MAWFSPYPPILKPSGIGLTSLYVKYGKRSRIPALFTKADLTVMIGEEIVPHESMARSLERASQRR
jgi:hypothetical protein